MNLIVTFAPAACTKRFMARGFDPSTMTLSIAGAPRIGRHALGRVAQNQRLRRKEARAKFRISSE
jgi:hypothetical protein